MLNGIRSVALTGFNLLHIGRLDVTPLQQSVRLSEFLLGGRGGALVVVPAYHELCTWHEVMWEGNGFRRDLCLGSQDDKSITLSTLGQRHITKSMDG